MEIRDSAVGIVSLIITVRGERVIIDRDLARIYGVSTARLNQQVKRNPHRFPEDFMFRMTSEEYKCLKLQNAISKNRRGERRKLPLAFTEHGAIMAANVLNSPRAVHMSVFVIRAFVKMREALVANKALAEKLNELEKKLTSRLDVHEKAIVHILNEIRKLMTPRLLPVPRGDRLDLGGMSNLLIIFYLLKRNWGRTRFIRGWGRFDIANCDIKYNDGYPVTSCDRFTEAS